MTTIDVASLCVYVAQRQWQSIQGRLRTWRDESVLGEGRREYHASRGRHFAPPAANSRSTGAERESEGKTNNLFWATSEPWRVRMERRHQTVPAIEGCVYFPDLLLADVDRWRAWYGDCATEGLTRDSVHGTLNLELLLGPSGLSRGLEFIEVEEVRRAGRRAFRLRGLPTSDIARYAPGMVALSATHYMIDVDAEFGILLTAEAYFDDRLARIEGLSELVIDGPIEPVLFSSTTAHPG